MMNKLLTKMMGMLMYYDIDFTINSKNTDYTWLVYPSCEKRLWEVDSVFEDGKEKLYVYVENKHHWHTLDAGFDEPDYYPIEEEAELNRWATFINNATKLYKKSILTTT